MACANNTTIGTTVIINYPFVGGANTSGGAVGGASRSIKIHRNFFEYKMAPPRVAIFS
jgi:hypothetical protein